MMNAQRALDIIKQLRDPETGCKWDSSQKLADMITPLRREVEELAEAISEGRADDISEELGDVLWNVLFIASMLEDSPQAIIDKTCEKFITRHPHVFGDLKAQTKEEALAHYKAAKERQKK